MCVAVSLFCFVFFNLVNWFLCLAYVSSKKKPVLKLRCEAKLGVAEEAAVDARESPGCPFRS